MMISDRHSRIMEELKRNPDIQVKELSQLLFVSEPTVRRDLTELQRRGLITKKYGGAVLNQGAADREIPFFIRENEKSAVKSVIGHKASKLVEDGMVVMLDGSTSAYHLVEYLARKKDLIVITSGAKTAVALAEANVRVFCTGGQMLVHSFSYVGRQAEDFVRSVNADLLFFSCHGLSLDGKMTDPALEEANLRRVMFESCRRKYLLCDSSKIGKTYLHTMGSVEELDGVISETALPEELTKRLRPEK